MPTQFLKLRPKQQRGSKPRCHLLTCGTKAEVAARLTSLIAPWGRVRPNDRWMPSGFETCAEAQLHSASEILPDSEDRNVLRDWWLAKTERKTTTPNIDLASTCLVEGQEGILLVEAKAHDHDLQKEEQGKLLKPDCSDGSRANHRQLSIAIEAANLALSTETKLNWSLSRDSHYQMSNRFAWAWKVTELGKAIILVYLAFTGCDEMSDQGRPIANQEEWRRLILHHSRPLFAGEVWGREWRVHGQALIPLILTTHQPLS